MSAESPRITELRRRVESDPSSIAFAQLAEEYRRAGNYDAAERYCRTGLARHPAYLSARVTLGRTLIELNKLDEAEMELRHVLTAAPDNLAALRGLAEIAQRLGRLDAALDYYRRALALARHDPDLEETVDRLSRTTAPPTAAPATTQAPMDFDALLDSLGIRNHPAPPSVEALLATAPTAAPQPIDHPLPSACDHPAASLEASDTGLPSAAGEPDWLIGPLPDISPRVTDDIVVGTELRATEVGGTIEALDTGETAEDSANALSGAPSAPTSDASRRAGDERVILDELEAWLKALAR